MTLACLLFISAGTPSTLLADSTTPPAVLIGTSQGFLEWAVEDYLQRSAIQARYEIDINSIDPRLRLTGCDRPLGAALESPAEPVGRVTVRVSCEGSTPWTVFVPGQVRLFRQVVVATQPMKRNAVISPDQVALAERDIGQIRQGYLLDVAQVAGQKLTRPVLVDQVFSPAFLELAEVIHRGEQVVILARTAGINVKMPGEALSDGAPGQQIRVRNQRSDRVVKARVTGPGQVEVEM